MNGGEVPTVEDVSAAADEQLLELYSDVMAELMVRGREEHRDHWGQRRVCRGPWSLLTMKFYSGSIELYTTR